MHRIEPALTATILPKLGERVADCEDSFCLLNDRETGALRATVADGASSASFSGIWAQLLAQAFAAVPYDGDWRALEERLRTLSAAWTRAVFSRNLPWHAIERAKRGSFATIAGLGLERDPEGGVWSAFALGDSCIFHVRDGRIETALPLADAAAFGNNPMLLSTDAERNAGLGDEFVVHRGRWRQGDIFLLATDAVSQAVCAMNANDPDNLPELLRACADCDDERRAAFFDSARTERRIKNDDIAVLSIEMV
ncbi:MAG: protein phosphatase 2C domain-containing protein [bacterium]|nr:protein phosphatase 2C domain-containing protein [bacterium]